MGPNRERFIDRMSHAVVRTRRPIAQQDTDSSISKEKDLGKLISTNPSRNYEIIGEVPISTERDIRGAVERAREALPNWAGMSLDERSQRLTSFIEVSKSRAEEIAQLIARETGRPIRSSRHNVQRGNDYLEAYLEMAGKYLAPQVTRETATEIHQVFREPRGVVAAILPWNYPFMNVAWQCGQALIAGNTIVYKNSEENPMFTELLAELIDSSDVPRGVFNVLYGDGRTGESLANQDIDMITFTGSTRTGHALARIAAERFVPIVTELGGSSPLVLFDDVELTDDIIAYIANSRFANSGQTCDSVKRLIVQNNRFGEVVNRVCHYISGQKIGDASDEDTEIGPLIAKRQVDLIEAQVQDAINRGAKVELGGAKPEGLLGAYYLPTVLTDVKPDMRVWQEETFGPILPIVAFETEEEAIRMANDTIYGLTAQVITNDNSRFQRVASQLKAGSVGQNRVNTRNPINPFGGYKESGMGRLHGEFGFNEVTQAKVVSAEK